jgi:hypothetical protein
MLSPVVLDIARAFQLVHIKVECLPGGERFVKSGWNLGCVSAVDSQGGTIWITDARRDGKRSVVRADEMLTAFIELESAIRSCVEFH